MSDAFEEFGPYLVYERLGQGGMATVHRAEKRGVGIRRPVALKRLLPHIAGDPTLVELFVDEARLASQLHHANIAQIYELGKVGDTFFIAMEYASGPTLAQVVRQCHEAAGNIPLPITVSILSQVCDALDYAHNLCDPSGEPLRIVHRDISPANIIVTNTGIVKLIDFGIAKATISRVKTQTGFIKGKFGYIAPEYLTGKIDARADLFALGVVAHEMMSGRRLFEGKDDFEILAKIREMKIVPPSQFNKRVTAEIDTIVMTALQRDPAQRWPSAAALQLALTQVARQFGTVIGSAQLADWVDWAFSQVPPGRDRSGDAARKAPGLARDPSSVAIHIERRGPVSDDAAGEDLGASGDEDGDVADGSHDDIDDEEELPATWPPETARPRRRSSDSERTRQVARSALRETTSLRDAAMLREATALRDAALLREATALRDAALLREATALRDGPTLRETTALRDGPTLRETTALRDAAPPEDDAPADEAVEPASRTRETLAEPAPRRTSRIRDAVVQLPLRRRESVVEPAQRGDDANTPLRGRDDDEPAMRRTSRIRDAVVDLPARGRDALAEPAMRLDGAETLLRNRDSVAAIPRRTPRSRDAIDESALGSSPGDPALDSRSDAVLSPRTDDAETMLRSRDDAEPVRRISRIRSVVAEPQQPPPRVTRSRDAVAEPQQPPPRVTRSRDAVAEPALRTTRGRDVIAELPLRAADSEPPGLPERFGTRDPSRLSDALDAIAEPPGDSDILDVLAESSDISGAFDALAEPPGLDDALAAIAAAPGLTDSDDLDAIAPTPPARRPRSIDTAPPLAASPPSRPLLPLTAVPAASRAASAPSDIADIPSLSQRYDAAPARDGMPALPRPAPSGFAALPAPDAPRASPPAWQIVPPAPTDAGPFEPARPAQRAASRAEPPPAATQRAPDLRRAKSTQKTRPASPYGRSLVLRILLRVLLLIVLGAGAMALAYFWPDL